MNNNADKVWFKSNVLKTYHKEFKYYCVTKYLEYYFKNEYNLERVYGSFLGVNFDIYKFRIITCEHNFSKNREKIHALLTSKGYVRKLSEISQFDDWYVNSNIY